MFKLYSYPEWGYKDAADRAVLRRSCPMDCLSPFVVENRKYLLLIERLTMQISLPCHGIPPIIKYLTGSIFSINKTS